MWLKREEAQRDVWGMRQLTNKQLIYNINLGPVLQRMYQTESNNSVWVWVGSPGLAFLIKRDPWEGTDYVKRCRKCSKSEGEAGEKAPRLRPFRTWKQKSFYWEYIASNTQKIIGRPSLFSCILVHFPFQRFRMKSATGQILDRCCYRIL